MAEKVASLRAQSGLPAGGRVLSDTLHLGVLMQRAAVLLQLGARSQKNAGAIRIAERPLPATVNTWSGDDPVFCRIAPDAWLILSAQHAAPDLLEAARAGCKRRSCALTDLSDAGVTLAIEGAQAPELLARGCGLDLADGAFGQDACTRTRLAQLPVLLRRVSHERYEIMVERPAAQYLHDWLQDAAVALV